MGPEEKPGKGFILLEEKSGEWGFPTHNNL